MLTPSQNESGYYKLFTKLAYAELAKHQLHTFFVTQFSLKKLNQKTMSEIVQKGFHPKASTNKN